MARKIVSLHAAYKSRGEVVDGFLLRPLTHKPTPASSCYTATAALKTSSAY